MELLLTDSRDSGTCITQKAMVSLVSLLTCRYNVDTRQIEIQDTFKSDG